MALVIMRLPSRHPGCQRKNRLSSVQRLHLAFFIDTQHDGPIWGLRYKPTMSRTFSTNCGSWESLKFCTRWGCNPKACQMRTIAVCDNPVLCAISRVLQWVL